MSRGRAAGRSVEGIEEAAVWGIGAKNDVRLYIPGGCGTQLLWRFFSG